MHAREQEEKKTHPAKGEKNSKETLTWPSYRRYFSVDSKRICREYKKHNTSSPTLPTGGITENIQNAIFQV